jgi:hypothetical protein
MAHRWDPRAPAPPPLVRPVPIDPDGVHGPTRRQAAGRYWRSTSRGLYVPADTDDQIVEQRILEQAMTLPADGAVTGWAACRLHAANFCDGLGRDGVTRLPVPLAVGPRGHIARRPGARLVFRPVPDVDRLTRYGIPTVTIERATYDAVLLAPDLVEAVVAIDVVAAAELMSLQMLREYAARQRFRKSRVDQALPLASEHSRSPNEVRLRMLAEQQAGLPRLLVNCPVHDRAGRLLGIADLLDLGAGLVVEFQGAEHRGAVRQTADLRKESAMRRVGLEVTGVSGLDLEDQDLVVHRLLEARSRALFESEADRSWIARPPADDLHQRLLTRRVLQQQHEWIESQPLPDIRELRGW